MSLMTNTETIDLREIVISNNDARITELKLLLSDILLDPTYRYDHEEFQELLKDCIILISNKHDQSYLEVFSSLIRSSNTSSAKSYVIHYAVATGVPQALQYLIEHGKKNINVKYKNNTPLLIAVKFIKYLNTNERIYIYKEIIEILLKEGCDVNIADGNGETAKCIAAKEGFESIINLLNNYSLDKIDIDTNKGSDVGIAETISETSDSQILDKISSSTLYNKLVNYIADKDEISFERKFNAIGKTTYVLEPWQINCLLHKSCDAGLENVVSLLLSAGADPLYDVSISVQSKDSTSSVETACIRGYHRILKLLLKHVDYGLLSANTYKNKYSLLHEIIKSKHFNETEITNHTECLKILLEGKYCEWINIGDSFHYNTPLHLATVMSKENAVTALLKKGACINIKNKQKGLPLAEIDTQTFESYLDECITSDGNLPASGFCKITISYNFLYPIMNDKLRDGVSVIDTDSLELMTQIKDLRPLLNHPVIASFLYLKWQRISFLFLLNIVLYSLFCLSLYAYILCSISKSFAMTSFIARMCSLFSLVILIFRELIQLMLSPVLYLGNIENCLETVLFIISAFILSHDNMEYPGQLSAVAVLLSAADLMLLFGRLPSFSNAIVMLKIVSLNYLKFLSLYSILIIAFSVSFYSVFYDEDTKRSNDTNNDFSHIGTSIFKTIIMLTGEFESGSIEFGLVPITSHIIFIIFVFMVPIVLFNLLSGLAVSDIQAIQADAEIWGHISRIDYLVYIQNILLNAVNPKSKLYKFFRVLGFFFRFRPVDLYKRIALFPEYLPKQEIVVNVHDRYICIPQKKDSPRTHKEFEGGYCFPWINQTLQMPLNIIEDANKLIRGKKCGDSQYEQTFENKFRNLFSQFETRFFSVLAEKNHPYH